ncbi:MAG: hypothetical protein EOL87_03435 [Spartobacteria bacterium]|nr:hypothetical protein [Spartobacteria bacterium]
MNSNSIKTTEKMTGDVEKKVPIIGTFFTILFLLFAGVTTGWTDTVDNLYEQCRANEWSPEQLQQLQSIMSRAQQTKCTLEPLVQRTSEGLAKGIDAERILTAMEQRTAHLEASVDIMRRAGCQQTPTIWSVAYALESGLSEATLMRILREGADRRPGQLSAVIESGESLHLSGMPDEIVEVLMLDYLKRNMRRGEIIRSSRYAVNQHQRGLQPTQLREKMWGAGFCSESGQTGNSGNAGTGNSGGPGISRSHLGSGQGKGGGR